MILSIRAYAWDETVRWMRNICFGCIGVGFFFIFCLIMKRQVFHSLLSIHASSIAFWLIGAWVFVLGVFLYNISYILSILLVALIVSFACEPLIIKRSRLLTRSWSIVFIYTMLTLILLLGFVIVVPLLLGVISTMLWQLSDFFLVTRDILATQWLQGLILAQTRLPAVAQEYLLDQLVDLERQQYLVQFLQSNLNTMVGFSQQFVTQFATLLSSALTFLSSLGSLIVYVSLTWIMTIMASIQHKKIESLFATFWPYTKPASAARFARLKTKLVSWLKGQAIVCSVMIIVMGCIYLIFSLVWRSIPYAWAFAILGGLMEIFPYVGPRLATVPALLMMLIYNGIGPALLLFVCIIVIQQLQGNILTPLVMAKEADTDPLLTIIIMVVAGILLWFIGLLLAVPLTIVISELYLLIVKEWVIRRSEED